MCGILGFFLNRPLTETDIYQGSQTLEALRHRGPDGSGIWKDAQKGVFLGHNRLSIVDLSEASSQPMQRSGTVLAYNGEIYNYRTIRAGLQALGWVFSSTGDTEVLLQAWKQWGPAALDRFDGMFAFALYDGELLHLVTDPFGEKPLYWAQTGEGIYFSSEAGPLSALIGDKRALSQEDVTAFMALGFLPGGRTGYNRIRRLAPATHLILNRTGVKQQRRYWKEPALNIGQGPVFALGEAGLDRIQEALVESVRERLHADVPLGLFLSGGLDSALTAAIAAKDLGVRLQCLTVAFPDGRDESQRAAAIARHLDLPHTVIESRHSEQGREADTVLDIFGELDANLTAIPAWEMARVARAHVKTVLTGIGGDELFYGYGRYQMLYHKESLLRAPFPVRALAAKGMALLGASGSAQTARALLSAPEFCQILAVKNGQSASWLWDLPSLQLSAERWFGGAGMPLAVNSRQFDLAETMPASYIPSIERAGMRASLEVRTAFLNRNLFTVLSQIDQRALVAFGQKSALRRLAARYLPQPLIDAPKQGFVFPQSRLINTATEAPRIEEIPERKRMHVWNNRYRRNWETIAVRLILLDRWLQRGEPATNKRQHALINAIDANA